MCGIAGVRRYGDYPITPEECMILLAQLEHRGNHATGIAVMHRGQIHICKAPRPAWSFIAEKETIDFMQAFLPDATMAILHTRAATIGNPEHNENNHPMFFGKSAVVHNGGIPNHQMLFGELKVPRSCETDSDVFRAILDSQGMTEQAIKTMNRLNGSAAIAAFSQDDPDKLILARSGSPLVYGTTDNKLWWASEQQAIQRAVKPWTSHHGLMARKSRGDISYFGMPDHTAYILSSKGLDRRFEFKVCSHYVQPMYRARETYFDKTRAFKREAKAERRRIIAGVPDTKVLTHKGAKCPKCPAFCIIARDKKFTDFICHACKITLAALDKLTDKELVFQEDPEKGLTS